jgi:hypothetical protein
VLPLSSRQTVTLLFVGHHIPVFKALYLLKHVKKEAAYPKILSLCPASSPTEHARTHTGTQATWMHTRCAQGRTLDPSTTNMRLGRSGRPPIAGPSRRRRVARQPPAADVMPCTATRSRAPTPVMCTIADTYHAHAHAHAHSDAARTDTTEQASFVRRLDCKYPPSSRLR